MKLTDLQQFRPTDKFNLGYIENFYEKHFQERRLSASKVLEIGIYGGESILLWHDFFTNAKVYGLDIEPRPNRPEFTAYDERLVLLDRTNAYSTTLVDTLRNMEPEGFDIIIDDGPHTFESMVFFIMHYLPLVKRGGVFVLEDIIDPNWTPILRALVDERLKTFAPNSPRFVYDMRGKQKTEFLYNHWMKGLDVLVVEVA